MSSPFINNLESQIARIHEIIKSPNLVDSKFNELLSIHDSLDKLTSDYISSTRTKIRDEIKSALVSSMSKYKQNYKTDIQKLDELNTNILHDSKSFKFKTLPAALADDFDDVEPELFDNSIYQELNEYVDLTITNPKNLTPEQKETIRNYKNIKEEIEGGLEDFIEDVKNFEKHAVRIRANEIKRGMECLDMLYVMHLNYLKAYSKNKNVEFNMYKLNGKRIDTYGKQTDFLNRYFGNC